MLRRSPSASTSAPVERKEKVRQCDGPNCEATFVPRTSMHSVCSPRCEIAKRKANEKAAKDRAKAERAADRAALEAMKRLPKLHAEARYWFNRWIRLRDAEKPCISCGAPPPDLTGFHSGRDCGHFRSVGQAGHLRYTEDNAAGQCVHCNQHLAGNYTGFRFGQIERIGLERVDALERDNRPNKWKREQVRAIRDHYKAACRELEKARGA